MLILSLHSKEQNLYNFHYVYTCLSDKLWENPSGHRRYITNMSMSILTCILPCNPHGHNII